MGAFSRGSRNAFRNPLRTLSVVAILGISLGLVMVMLAARGAVTKRINDVKTSIGNVVTVSPAGARGFLGGGEPLTQAQIDGLKGVNGVTSIDATVDAQIRPGTDTTLASPIEPGTLGNRQGRIFRSGGSQSANGQAETFAVPIFAIGTNNATFGGEQIGTTIKLSSGSLFDASSDTNVALVGKSLAEKNNLSVGSSFTAYNETITVNGIYDVGNEFGDNSMVFPLHTLQRLSDQTDQITTAVVHVDSVDNLSAVTSAIQSKLGSAADVTSSADSVQNAVKPLESIRTIATTSLLGALIAAAVITLLTMVMIVRERRKEIAVLKAIGAGDATIVTQFITESIVLSFIGGVIGTVLGFVLSNPILHALLTSTESNGGNGGPSFASGGPGGAATGVRFAIGGFRAVRGAVQNLNAAIDLRLILYGLLAAVVIAVIGSAFPAWLIAKIRPAEVLRSE